MPEKNTDNRDKILDAMWRGDLSVKEEEHVEEPVVKEEPERSEEEKKARLRDVMEHLLSGRAFKERVD